MKNNKGFTLAELLAIIIVIAVIMVIAAPSMSKQIKKSEEENQNVLNKKIEDAAHLYAAKYHADQIVINSGAVSGTKKEISFTLKQLQQDGLINLKGNCVGALTNGSKIKVGINGKYDYKDISNEGSSSYTDCYVQ